MDNISGDSNTNNKIMAVRDKKGIRAWLFKNKIIFETLTASLLALMAIVVALEANH